MKIAFIVDAFPNVSETFVLNQITGLIDLGHMVEIFAGARSPETKMHQEIEDYGLLKRTYYHNEVPRNSVYRTIKSFLLFILLFPRYPMVILRSLNLLRYGRDASSLNLFYKAALFLRKGDFDIIHCHFGPNGMLGVLLKEMGIPGKILTTFHGYDVYKYVSRKGKGVYRSLFSQGDLFLPISDYWKRRLMKLGCPQDKLIIHHMGVDIDRFELRLRGLDSGEKVNVLTVARLIPKKGLEYSIRAVARTLDVYPNIRYEIVGDGPMQKELENLVASLGVERQVSLSGWKVGAELAVSLRKAHIFLLHSVTDSEGNMEGIPVSLMEAQAVGLPVVSTYHSGIPELVSNEKSGFLVPEKDVVAMAQRLEYLVKHPDVWANMGREGRKIIEKRFDIARLNKKLVRIYADLLG
jgi:colanic acid/amylovoran biosynthesis glycosyltransferase